MVLCYEDKQEHVARMSLLVVNGMLVMCAEFLVHAVIRGLPLLKLLTVGVKKLTPVLNVRWTVLAKERVCKKNRVHRAKLREIA